MKAVTVTLYILTALVTGLQNFYWLMDMVNGAPLNLLNFTALLGSVTLVGAAMLASFRPHVAAVEMKLTNMLSGEEVRARTLAVRRSKGGRVLGVAVELLFPSETFWGLAFRLRKTTAELQRLEQDIKSEKIDPRQRMVGLQGLSRKRLLQQVCDFRQYSGIAIS
jgi:hypothetical protein